MPRMEENEVNTKVEDLPEIGVVEDLATTRLGFATEINLSEKLPPIHDHQRPKFPWYEFPGRRHPSSPACSSPGRHRDENVGQQRRSSASFPTVMTLGLGS